MAVLRRALLALVLGLAIGATAQEQAEPADGGCQAHLATCQTDLAAVKSTVEQWQAYSETLKLDIQSKATEASTCADNLQAAQATAAQTHKATETAVAAAMADAYKQVHAAEAQVKTLTAQLQQAQAALAGAQSQASTAKGELASLKGELASTKAALSTAQSELSTARSQPQAGAKLDTAQVVEFLSTSARALASSSAAEAKLLFEELKQGNCSRLTKLTVQGSTVVANAARGAWAFVVKEADEHIPESVKAQAREAYGKANAAWKKHVLDATWAQGIIQAVSTANRELKAVLTTLLKKQPALSHLADPVTVQLIVYGIIGLPLLVLLLLPLLMLLSSPSRPASQAAADTKGKKGGKGGKPTGGKNARVKA